MASVWSNFWSYQVKKMWSVWYSASRVLISDCDDSSGVLSTRPGLLKNFFSSFLFFSFVLFLFFLYSWLFSFSLLCIYVVHLFLSHDLFVFESCFYISIFIFRFYFVFNVSFDAQWRHCEIYVWGWRKLWKFKKKEKNCKKKEKTTEKF